MAGVSAKQAAVMERLLETYKRGESTRSPRSREEALEDMRRSLAELSAAETPGMASPDWLLKTLKKDEAKHAAKGDQVGVGVALVNQSQTLLTVRRFDEAIAAAKRACDLYEVLLKDGHDHTERCDAIASYAAALEMSGKPRLANPVWAQSRDACLIHGRKRAASEALMAVARSLESQGNPSMSVIYAHRRKALAELAAQVRANDPDDKLQEAYGLCLMSVAEDYHRQARLADATETYIKAAQQWAKVKDSEQQGNAWSALGMLAALKKGNQNAADCYMTAYNHYMDAENLEEALAAIMAAAATDMMLDNWDGAKQCLDWALGRYMFLKDAEGAARCVGGIRKCNVLLKDAKKVSQMPTPVYDWYIAGANGPMPHGESDDEPVDARTRAGKPSGSKEPAEEAAPPKKKKNKKKKKKRKTAAGQGAQADEGGSSGGELEIAALD